MYVRTYVCIFTYQHLLFSTFYQNLILWKIVPLLLSDVRINKSNSYTGVYAFTDKHTHMHKHTHTYMYACMCILHTYTHMEHAHACLHMCTHKYIHMNTHIHTNICTQSKNKSKAYCCHWTVMPTQTSWDACAPSRHCKSVQDKSSWGWV